jgi:quinol monooxygenase YgiN
VIQIVVVITAKPGERAAVLEAFKAVVPAVHAEQGCIEYGAFEDIDGYGPPQTPVGKDSFVVVEKWSGIAELKAHARAPHMVAYAAKVKDRIKSRTVHLLSPA